MKKAGTIFNMLYCAFLLLSSINIFGQGTPGVPGKSCDKAGLFCSDDPRYTFPAQVGTPSFGKAACLVSTQNPAWYVMQVATPGRINIHMYTVPQEDIDFACWGPFPSATAGCGNLLYDCGNCENHPSTSGANPANLGGYPIGNLVDCSFYYLEEEYVHIPNAQVGEWYILLVTNYSNNPCKIHIGSDTTSIGTTNCSLLSPLAVGDTVCEGESATLKVSTAVPGATYIWKGPNGFSQSVQEPQIAIPNATLLDSGQYSLIISLNGIPGSPSFCNLQVHPKPRLTLTRDSICSGQNTVITASGADTYLWNTNAKSAMINVSPDKSTLYSVVGATAFGCKDSASTQVVVYDHIAITVTPAVVCSGETAVASAPNVQSFQWNNGGPASAAISVEVNSPQVFTVTAVMKGGCVGTGTLTVNPNPVIMATGDVICRGESAILRAMGASAYTWSNGQQGESIIVMPEYTTKVSVVGVSDFGCVGRDTATVIVFPKPIANFEADKYEVSIDEPTISFSDLSSDATSWEWNFGEFRNPINTSTESDPVHTYISTGIFKVWQFVFNEYTCKDSTFRQIQVQSPFFFYVPTGFSPDNDGLNEQFCPVGNGISPFEYSMQIFDRWGALMFKSVTPLECWDGKMDGTLAPEGIYIYKISLKDTESNYHEYHGEFTLLR